MINFQDARIFMWKVRTNMSSREKAILGALLGLLVISLSLSITGYVNRNSTLVAQDGGTYTEAVVGQPRYINPVLASANDADLDLTRIIYSSLFRVGSDLTLTNDLATSVETSEDGKTYTIRMRDDATWHDGEKVTAEDVLFTITSIQTKDYNSPLASAFQGVTIKKIDDYTVEFSLQKTAYAPFLTSLTVGILPKHVWESVPPKSFALAEQELKPIGSGPFKFEEIVTRKKTGEVTSITLARNESYYGKRPHLLNVTFTFLNTHEEALAALTSGKADGIGYLPSSIFPSVEHRGGVKVHTMLLPQYFGLFFNQAKNPALGDAGLRSALDLAIDREAIVKEALSGQGEPLGIPIPSGFFSFSDIRSYSYDPEKAKQNLEDGGWKIPEGGSIREKDGKQLEITITTTDWPEYIKTAEMVQKQWEEIGVKTNLQSLGTGIIQQTAVAPREYEVLLYGENLPGDPDPYPFWHSSQVESPGLNLSILKDKDIDKLLEDARTTTDTQKRKELLHAFIERFLDLHPAIVLYRPYYLFAQDSDIRGAEMNQGGLPSDRFNDIENWHVRVKRVWNT